MLWTRSAAKVTTCNSFMTWQVILFECLTEIADSREQPCYDSRQNRCFSKMAAAMSSGHVYKFGLFEANVARNTLTRDGVRVRIQDQPFHVLLLLLDRAGEIVTREELRQKLWPQGTHVDFEGSLNVILKKLRAAVSDDPDNPRFIETVPRHGYRFIAPVSVESVKATAAPPVSAVGQTLRAEPEAKALSAPLPSKRRALTVKYAASFLGFVFLIGATWFAWHRRQITVKARSLPSDAASPVRPITLRKSVAVLGFHNISGKMDDAWLATALSEMLSTELAGGEKLRLVSGEDVANLRLSSPWSQTDTLSQETTARVGTALNSDFLVLGSYASVGRAGRGRLRLDVRLQDAKTGEILTEVAEIGSNQEMFRIVSRVGARLRDRLGVPRLPETDEAGVLAALPLDPEAARFYALGLSKLRQFDVLAAKDLFEQATGADPKFSLGHAMLARAWSQLGYEQKRREEAKKALDLSTDLPRIDRMLVEGDYYESLGNHEKAASSYRALFELFPDSVDYGLQLAVAQNAAGHGSQALETIRQLRELPPPLRDDPELDLAEGAILFYKDAAAAERLYHSAAGKALAQEKKLIHAKAQERICFVNSQHLQAPPECTEAYEAFLAAGNRGEAASCLQLMAEMNRLSGHDEEAIPLYEQAARTFREVGDRGRLGVALNNLSLVLENRGQWLLAEQFFREVKRNSEAINSRGLTAVAVGNIADIEVFRGHLRQAAQMYRQAWELADASGRRHEYAHLQYASLLLMQGELEQSRLEVEPQITSLRAYGGDPWLLAVALTELGDIEKTKGNLNSARKDYQEALDTFKKVNFSVANTQVSLAELSTAEGHPDAAEVLLQEALAKLQKQKSAGDEIGAYQSLSHALLAQGKLAKARDAIGFAFKLADLQELPVLRLPLQLLQARVAAAAAKPGIGGRKELSAASQAIRDVILKSQQLGLYSLECEARLALGEAEVRLNPAAGRTHLSVLAAEARNRGFELLARQADQALNTPGSVVAANKPMH